MSYIYSSNHPTTIDPIVLFFYFFFTGKFTRILITWRAWEVPIFNRILDFFSHIQVSENNPKNCLSVTLNELTNEKNVLIFPEGNISGASNKVLKFKTGVIRLALESHKEIIPIGIKCLKTTSFKIGNFIITIPIGKYSFKIGKPIKFTGNKDDKLLVNNLCSNLREEIIKLSV